MSLSDTELDMAMEVALRAAHISASVVDRALEEHDGTLLEMGGKSDTDLLVSYTRECEAAVVAVLGAGTPDFNIHFGDERAEGDDRELDGGFAQGRPVWVVDAVGGAGSFAHGLFDCGIAIALVVAGRPVVGVVSAPRLREVFAAVRGRGATCNGQRIHVSQTRSLNKSLVLLRQSRNRSEAAVESLIGIQSELTKLPVHAVRSYGSTALNMCFVASGRAELYFEVGINSWNIAAGAIIVQEAGGVVHNIDDTQTLDLMSRGVCCANSLEISQVGVELSKKYDYKQNILGI
ncbi:myo-inositol-1(or 4)-monophosphatase 1 [Trypanosoma theileri]|uniref:Myo-inositol-1(Or 4)-monophosphatase 1 n=1 Tax=Trypanosoma theileri TaxID=67003 RepID=A0A1X0NSL5_9TRYP|nr:myo-inositol-1(or 4)-monophosphatase 1 [Trypanosoma theileri]ORC87705.1 myo-inositol-1(or 4)-monophosphatase 1 [Trypanosoma theileri]